MKMLIARLKEEIGQGLVEYSLIIFLVIIGLVLVVGELGNNLASYYQNNIIMNLP